MNSRLRPTGAIQPHEGFLVYNSRTGKPVQSNYSEKSAQHAVDVLNDHEKRNGRDQVYIWRKR